ncbi:hypothetical protein GCM10010172_80980 [Paractinoplanes ferrugineus]|uniref:Uncharacterized protein n=2 Tax=Paractinoplanes ferrugineus TaxID=113564 RepID=A0A919J0Y6_9ACTN|nr:hypothetical protein Afe05nite_22590 [Actinoplanes ferrugineus]
MVTVMADLRPRQARRLDVLIGHRLEYVRLDHAIVLSLSNRNQVVIEAPALLVGPNGPFAVEPGVTSSDVLATLLGETVRTARARETGELEVTFGSGSQLLVAPDPDFESWALVGPAGLLLVCLAGGELAVWGDA